jgi:hypothetical protein
VRKKRRNPVTSGTRSLRLTVKVVARPTLDQPLSGKRLTGLAALAGSISRDGRSAAAFRATIRDRNFRD